MEVFWRHLVAEDFLLRLLRLKLLRPAPLEGNVLLHVDADVPAVLQCRQECYVKELLILALLHLSLDHFNGHLIEGGLLDERRRSKRVLPCPNLGSQLSIVISDPLLLLLHARVLQSHLEPDLELPIVLQRDIGKYALLRSKFTVLLFGFELQRCCFHFTLAICVGSLCPSSFLDRLKFRDN